MEPRVLHRIGRKVQKDLAYAQLVSRERLMLHLRAIDAQLLTLRLSLRTDDGLYPAHDVIDVEPTLLKLHLPAFDARHVQNVVYKLQQMTRRRGDGIEATGYLLAGLAAFPCDLRHAHDGVDGRAYVVRHVRKELALRLVRRSCDIERLLEHQTSFLLVRAIGQHQHVLIHPFDGFPVQRFLVPATLSCARLNALAKHLKALALFQRRNVIDSRVGRWIGRRIRQRSYVVLHRFDRHAQKLLHIGTDVFDLVRIGREHNVDIVGIAHQHAEQLLAALDGQLLRISPAPHAAKQGQQTRQPEDARPARIRRSLHASANL